MSRDEDEEEEEEEGGAGGGAGVGTGGVKPDQRITGGGEAGGCDSGPGATGRAQGGALG